MGAYEFDGSVNESLLVTTAADELNVTSDPSFGAGTSLREALVYAHSLGGARTITFAPSLAGQTVTLSNAWDNANGYNSTSAVRIDGNITIAGPASAPGVTLKVADASQLRHFVISSGATLALQNLTLSGGKPTLSGFDFGGAVWSFGSLIVRNCTFTGNTAGSEGGAIQSWGDSPLLTIDNSTFSGNHSNGIAGAIDCGATSMTFRHVTIANNSATNGHALVIWGHPLTMINSIIAGNTDEGVSSANNGTLSGASTNNILSSATAPGLTNGTNANQLGVPVSQLMFGSFGKNGGPTATIPLQSGSIAIDAGRRHSRAASRSTRADPQRRCAGRWRLRIHSR
jgi:predicted outer membrane repeat protein